jgi:hypothetical protein
VTYTYVIMHLSPAAYEEIAEKMRTAGYGHVFHESRGETVIDMHGIAVAAGPDEKPRPIDMILYCPRCGTQHIDAPEPERDWTNPSHRSHLCHFCECVFRPADVPTNGVARITTCGENDTWPPEDTPKRIQIVNVAEQGCRRCVDCEGQHHHWIEDPREEDVDAEYPADYACKHCMVRGVECSLCAEWDEPDEDCLRCHGEGVVTARTGAPTR